MSKTIISVDELTRSMDEVSSLFSDEGSVYERNWLQEFKDKDLENRFLVYWLRNRATVITFGKYAIMSMLSEFVRLAPAFGSTTNGAIVIVAFMAVLLQMFLLLATGLLSRAMDPVGAPSKENAETTTSWTNIALTTVFGIDVRDPYQNAMMQELFIGIASVGGALFLAVYVISEKTCPWLDSIGGKEFMCLNSSSYDTPMHFILLLLPTMILPIRLSRWLIVRALTWVIYVTSDYYDVGLFPDGRDPTATYTKIAKWIFCMAFGIGAQSLAYSMERNIRSQFIHDLVLHDLRWKMKTMHEDVCKQTTASLPAHVARRLITGTGGTDSQHSTAAPRYLLLADENPNAVVLVFCIVGFSRMCNRLSSTVVVENLNCVFRCLDSRISTSKFVEKMQTVGDMYVCIGSDVEARVDYEDKNGLITQMAQLEAVKLLADDLLRQTSTLCQPAFAMEIGHVTCTVLGSTMSYVAVGDCLSRAINDVRGLTATTVHVPNRIARLLEEMKKHRHHPSGQRKPPSGVIIGAPPLSKLETRQFQEHLLQMNPTMNSSGTATMDTIDVIPEVPLCATTAKWFVFKVFDNPSIEHRYNEHLSCSAIVTALRAASHTHWISITCAMIIMEAIQLSWQLDDTQFSLSYPDVVASEWLWVGICLVSIVQQVAAHLLQSASPVAVKVRDILHLDVAMKLQIPLTLLKATAMVLSLWLLPWNAFVRMVDTPVIIWVVIATGQMDTFLSTTHSIAGALVFVFIPLATLQLYTILYDARDFMSTRDRTIISIFLVYVQVSGLPGFLILSRAIIETRSRDYFITKYYVVEETKLLQNRHALIKKMVSTIIPEYVIQKFEAFAKARAPLPMNSNGMGDPVTTIMRVDPWLGSWFSTKVEDQAIMILQLIVISSNQENHDDGHPSSVVESLQRSYQVVEHVLETHTRVARVKCAGDIMMFVGREGIEEHLRGFSLQAFAVDLLSELDTLPKDASLAKIVLNSGLSVGAVIGSDRLSFEFFGEAITTSMELLTAMPVCGIVATDRFVSHVDEHPLEAVTSNLSAEKSGDVGQVWRVRGGGSVRVHSIAVQNK